MTIDQITAVHRIEHALEEAKRALRDIEWCAMQIKAVAEQMIKPTDEVNR